MNEANTFNSADAATAARTQAIEYFTARELQCEFLIKTAPKMKHTRFEYVRNYAVHTHTTCRQLQAS